MPKLVLIADDNSLVRGLLRKHLEGLLACRCEEAADGMEALERASELAPDLVILDFSMPRMNGIRVAAILKDTMPHTPIVIFTSHDAGAVERQARAVGVRAVVSKTSQIDVLLEEVKKVLEFTGSSATP